MVQKSKLSNYVRSWYFVIFKMHLRVSAWAIFDETPSNESNIGYYKLIEYQLQYAFLHHLPWPVNMVEIFKCPLWDMLIFCDFQNPSPRQCYVLFAWYSCQLSSHRILQTGKVSASTLICTPLAMACQHAPKIEIPLKIYQNHVFAGKAL